MTFEIPSFETPGQIYVKRGSMALVRQLAGTRSALVCGEKSLETNGRLVKIEGLLQAAGLERRVFRCAAGEPDLHSIRELGARLGEWQPDWILAVGGGSVIDAAKGAWICYEHPEHPIELSGKRIAVPLLRDKARFIAIPTTSGCGSEVSSSLLLRDAERGVKVPIVSTALVPDIAIIDSAMADGMPPALTAATGFAALAHALEAYVSVLHSELTDALAVQATRCLLDALQRVYQDSKDIEARDAVHVAATMAGMARSNASTGLCQAFGHVFGARFGIPHGVANALFLIAVMEFNMIAGSRYERLAAALGMESADELLVSVYRLRARLDLPEALDEVGVDRDTLLDERDALLAGVSRDPGGRTNPRRPRKEDLYEIIELVSRDLENAKAATAVIQKPSG